MNRLEQMLLDYQIHWRSEVDQNSAALFLEFLRTQQQTFARANTFGHFTGSALVISPDHERICLVFHKKLQKWLQPGGHADGNERMEDVALKEVEEETGITHGKILPVFKSSLPTIFDLDRHTIPRSAKDPEHFHYDVRFLVQAGAEDKLTISEESSDLKWWSIDSAKTLNPEDSMRRLYNKLALVEDVIKFL